MTIESVEVFIGTDNNSGIPFTPIDNTIIFKTPIKYTTKIIWACKDTATDHSYAVLFAGINCTETKAFQKIIDGKIFDMKNDKNMSAQMILTGDENGIDKMFLLIK